MARLLFVHARAGAPPEYTIPKVAAVAPTHVLAITPLSPTARAVADEHCESVTDLSERGLRGGDLVDRIVAAAREVRADGVLTFSEFAVMAVAAACRRLGMPGPGANVGRSRDKRLMRRVWADAGVPVPTWVPVESLESLRSAWHKLTPPLLLKSAWSAAAVGQVLIRDEGELTAAWEASRAALTGGRDGYFAELGSAVGTGGSGAAGAADFLADELIPSTIRSWYTDDRYGDHISVEGVVAAGRYHPVCITSKAPTTAPFTERANFTPCALPPRLQRKIEAVARVAVDALELDTCATHTEMKLLDDENVCLLETASRFGGVLLTREVEHAHGVDMIGAYARAALGQDAGLPDRMIVDPAARAAGSVALYAADAQGRPWTSHPVFDADAVDWSSLVSPGTEVEVFHGLTVAPGNPMPVYDAAKGYLNSAGLVFLTAPSSDTLVADAHSIMNGLEHAIVPSGRAHPVPPASPEKP